MASASVVVAKVMLRVLCVEIVLGGAMPGSSSATCWLCLPAWQETSFSLSLSLSPLTRIYYIALAISITTLAKVCLVGVAPQKAAGRQGPNTCT